jgi:hypothetical protein
MTPCHEPAIEISPLQRLIDEGARTREVVEIPAGRHMLHDSLHLRSGVHLVGHPDAVITRAPSFCSRVADFLGYGLREISVAEPERFRAGMGVFIADDNAGGFYTTVATIIGNVGERFLIDRPLNHDYLPASNGTVSTLFPLLSGIGVEDVVIENLVLDGNPDETRVLNGCRGGGVFLLGAQRVRLQNLEVRDYKGDAISFQQCADIEVRGCHLHRNAGSGLHPGSGSVRYVFEGNNVHHNGGDGLFYCLRTTHSRCENNRFENNGRAGISIGERDTDHLIRGNVIAHNAEAGIHFRPALANGADRVRIEENTFGPNGLEKSEAEISIDAGLHEIAIVDNQFKCSAHKALVVADDCSEIFFVSNTVNGRAQSAEDISGGASVVNVEAPRDFSSVGPVALPPDGARHLNIEVLAPVTHHGESRTE